MTPTEFKSRMPEFQSTEDAKIQTAINDALPLLDADAWGDLYSVGLSNLVAHELTMSNAFASGTLGGLANDSSIKIGDVQVTADSVALGKQMADPCYRTIYGQKYLRYRRIISIGAVSL